MNRLLRYAYQHLMKIIQPWTKRHLNVKIDMKKSFRNKKKPSTSCRTRFMKVTLLVVKIHSYPAKLRSPPHLLDMAPSRTVLRLKAPTTHLGQLPSNPLSNVWTGRLQIFLRILTKVYLARCPHRHRYKVKIHQHRTQREAISYNPIKGRAEIPQIPCYEMSFSTTCTLQRTSRH